MTLVIITMFTITLHQFNACYIRIVIIHNSSDTIFCTQEVFPNRTTKTILKVSTRRGRKENTFNPFDNRAVRKGCDSPGLASFFHDIRPCTCQ